MPTTELDRQLALVLADMIENLREAFRELAEKTGALLGQVETLTSNPDDPAYDEVRDALRRASRIDGLVDEALKALRDA